MVQIGQKYLAVIIEVLQQSQAQGKLVGRRSQSWCELHFRQGKLVHALSNNDEQGDALLYELLNWPAQETTLEWFAENNSLPATIDNHEEAAWLDALKLLQKRGYFLSSEDSQVRVAVESWLGKISAKETTTTSRPKSPVTTNFKTNKTLLPLGIISAKLGGSVPQAGFNKYLTDLAATNFSGYLRCQPFENTTAKFSQALLIVERGEILEASTNLAGEAEIVSGRDALNYLNEARLNMLAVEVAPELVEAWRSLINGENPYSGVTATSGNYQNLLRSFGAKQRSGAVRLYSEKLELFGFVQDGKLLGIFKPESKSGSQVFYLQEQDELPEGLLDQPGIRMDVFLTPPPLPLRPEVEQLSAEEVELIDRSFQAIIRLSGELATPEKIDQHLKMVILSGSKDYPLLNNLSTSKQQGTPLPRLDLKKAESKITATPKKEALATFNYLFEEFLQDYCKPIGPEIFHPMVARTLGQSDGQKLVEIGLELDFLIDEPTANSPDIDFSSEPTSDIINPYDF